MQLAITFISLLLTVNTFATSVRRPFYTTVEGQVKIVKSSTFTCSAIGCPPSQAYYTAKLVNAKIDGVKEQVHSVELQDLEKRFDVSKYPTYFNYGGVRLRDGMIVQMEGLISVQFYTLVTYGFFTDPVEIKILGKSDHN